MNKPVAWGQFDTPFLEELSTWIGDRKVLEVFSGNGLLAKLLQEKSVSITATSLFSSHDGHEDGMHFDVIEMEAAEAVYRYGDEHDILLMSWPVASEGAANASMIWGKGPPIVFIGEVTNPDMGLTGLSGCASDAFFDLTTEIIQFSSYRPRNILERAAVRTVNFRRAP